LKYKLPSFCKEQLPMNLYDLNNFKYFYYVFITPKNKEGISSIYMNKNLYDLYKKNNIE